MESFCPHTQHRRPRLRLAAPRRPCVLLLWLSEAPTTFLPALPIRALSGSPDISQAVRSPYVGPLLQRNAAPAVASAVMAAQASAKLGKEGHRCKGDGLFLWVLS